MGIIRRDPRLRDVAVRVDCYERARYAQHPRCVRPKRGTPEAHAISVEAITRALERVVESKVYKTLDEIERRFRAVVELNWDAAERKSETWDWWTGSAMWAPNSLERVLGWLDEQRNWIYLERADGKSPLPARTEEAGESLGDVADLSPAEQQRAYDEANGIDPDLAWGGGKTAGQVFDAVQRRRSSSHSSMNTRTGEITDHPDFGATVDEYTSELAAHFQLPKSLMLGQVPGGIIPGIYEYSPPEKLADEELTVDPGAFRMKVTRAEDDESKRIQVSIGGHELKCIADGRPILIDPSESEPRVFNSWAAMDRHVELKLLPVITVKPTDAELRAIGERKSAYMKATTPEQRAADAKAGRKPWEVGS